MTTWIERSALDAKVAPKAHLFGIAREAADPP
jgi:hypothetical protein